MSRTIAELVPHAPPMLWVDEVLAHDSACIEVQSTVGASWPGVRGGTLSSVCAVEMVAQAAAVHAGLQGRGGGGYVVRCPSAVLSVARVAVGDLLHTTVRIAHEGPLVIGEGVVRRGLDTVATLRVGILTEVEHG